jgi:TRAP-type C4-dicarboxylate transport system substrate-binding protein
LATLVTPAIAQEVPTLRFAMTAPQTTPTWKMWWEDWFARIESESEGSMKIQTYFGTTLANMNNVYDRTVNGVADLGYGITSVLRGKTPGTNVIELPSEANGREASAGMWRLFQDGLTAAEWNDVHLLSLFVYPQTIMHFQKPITRLEDIKGMKIGAASKVSGDIIERLGAAQITTNPSEMYENLNRRLITGMSMAWTGVLQFKLHEVTNYHLNVEFGSGGGFLAANKETWAKLPAKGRAAFDRNSYYGLSKAFGGILDQMAANQRKEVAAMPGHTDAVLDPAEKRRWQSLAAPVVEEWVKATPNGAAILAAFNAEVARVRAER